MYCVLPKEIKKKKKTSKEDAPLWVVSGETSPQKKALFSSYISIFSHVCITFAFGKDFSYFRGRWF